ncbi:hypothetical protein ACJX0J_024054 [Zea mays]
MLFGSFGRLIMWDVGQPNSLGWKILILLVNNDNQVTTLEDAKILTLSIPQTKDNCYILILSNTLGICLLIVDLFYGVHVIFLFENGRFFLHRLGTSKYKVIMKLIEANQYGFIKGRSIQDFLACFWSKMDALD